MKIFTSASQKLGELGEDLACRYLVERGCGILERNYTKKWGEIDIVAVRGNTTHFIEVKSVSRENVTDISRETELLRPEDQMHEGKQERLRRTIETYLMEHGALRWQFDLICVYIDEKGKRVRVKVVKDIVL